MYITKLVYSRNSWGPIFAAEPYMKLFYKSPGLGLDQVWQKKNCDGVNGTKHLCWWTWIVLLFTLGQPSMDFGPILAEIWTNDLRHSTQLGSGLASIIKVFIAFLMFPLFTADTIQRNGFSISAYFCCENAKILLRCGCRARRNLGLQYKPVNLF